MQIKTRDTKGRAGARANTRTGTHTVALDTWVIALHAWRMYRGQARSISRAEGLANIYALFTPSFPANPPV